MRKLKKTKRLITALLILLVGLMLTALCSFLFIVRKYRFYKFTLGIVSDMKDYLTEEPDVAEAAEDIEESEYKYVYSDSGGASAARKEPWYYTNMVPGEAVTANVVYGDNPVYVSFAPEYPNGYLYPDGTQTEMEMAYAYEDSETGEVWYAQNPYQYKNCRIGKEYERVPYNNPFEVKIRFTAEYESGLIYPDGTQEEVY